MDPNPRAESLALALLALAEYASLPNDIVDQASIDASLNDEWLLLWPIFGPPVPLCPRTYKNGRPCRHPRLRTPISLGWMPSCGRHLSPEERTEFSRLQAVQDQIDEGFTPSCWTWPIPQRDGIEKRISDSANGDETVIEFIGHDDFLFHEFHDGRCAICGRRTDLVEDHDHETGLRRGYLCASCNISEGVSRHPLFSKYRDRNPASILGVQIVYSFPFDRRQYYELLDIYETD